MMDYQAFRIRADAKEYARTMRGWSLLKPAHIYAPEHWAADRKGNIWAIECEPGKYLRQDGYVR